MHSYEDSVGNFFCFLIVSKIRQEISMISGEGAETKKAPIDV